LRVLQEREVLPVGATRPVKVDIRVVAATHRDLPALIEAGEFRNDLYARLRGFVLELPLLAERREDLGLFLGEILPRVAPPGRADALTLSTNAARALYEYDWPLNVRELEQCLASAAVLATDGQIDLPHLPPAIEERIRPAGAKLSDEDAELRARLVGLLASTAGISAAWRARWARRACRSSAGSSGSGSKRMIFADGRARGPAPSTAARCGMEQPPGGGRRPILNPLHGPPDRVDC
jgi:DNA-binding NtrC family response regulator